MGRYTVISCADVASLIYRASVGCGFSGNGNFGMS